MLLPNKTQNGQVMYKAWKVKGVRKFGLKVHKILLKCP